MSSVTTLNDLFEETLKDIYYAEKAILKALPKMAKKASSETLAEAFNTHFEQTQGQVERLEQVFEQIGVKAKGKQCPAIDGIIEEAQELMKEVEDEFVLDAAMLAAAQAVEHYEISRYGTLVAWSQTLGYTKATKLLQATLDEESETDELLSELAESEINDAANNDEDSEQTQTTAKKNGKKAA